MINDRKVQVESKFPSTSIGNFNMKHDHRWLLIVTVWLLLFTVWPLFFTVWPLLFTEWLGLHIALHSPIPILLLRHDTSATTTGYNRSPTLSPRLDLPGFWPGTKTKREVWLLWTWFGITPVNKLVFLTWLLWALRSFRRFTLHSMANALHSMSTTNHSHCRAK